MSLYITKHYDRLDRICFDRYGTTSNQIVEFILDQNPGLDKEAILLTPGITINLPDPPQQLTKPPTLKQIFLWT